MNVDNNSNYTRWYLNIFHNIFVTECAEYLICIKLCTYPMHKMHKFTVSFLTPRLKTPEKIVFASDLFIYLSKHLELWPQQFLSHSNFHRSGITNVRIECLIYYIMSYSCQNCAAMSTKLFITSPLPRKYIWLQWGLYTENNLQRNSHHNEEAGGNWPSYWPTWAHDCLVIQLWYR